MTKIAVGAFTEKTLEQLPHLKTMLALCIDLELQNTQCALGRMIALVCSLDLGLSSPMIGKASQHLEGGGIGLVNCQKGLYQSCSITRDHWERRCLKWIPILLDVRDIFGFPIL